MGKKNNKNNKTKGKPQSPSVKIPPTPISATQSLYAIPNDKKKSSLDSQSNLGSPYHTPLTSPSTPTPDFPSIDLVVQQSSDSAETQKHDTLDLLPDPDTEAERDHNQEQSNEEQRLGGLSGAESNSEPDPIHEKESDAGQEVSLSNLANQHQEEPIPLTLGETKELFTEREQERSEQSEALPDPDPYPEELLPSDSLSGKHPETTSEPEGSLDEHIHTVEASERTEEQGAPEVQTEAGVNAYNPQTEYTEASQSSPEVAGQTEAQVQAETSNAKDQSATAEDQTQAQHEAGVEGIRPGEELAAANTEPENARGVNIQPEAVEAVADMEVQSGEDANNDPANATAEAFINVEPEAGTGIEAKFDVDDEVEMASEAEVDIKTQENERRAEFGEETHTGSESLVETGVRDVQPQSDNKGSPAIEEAGGRAEADGEGFNEERVGVMMIVPASETGLEDQAEILAVPEAEIEAVDQPGEEEEEITIQGHTHVERAHSETEVEENVQDISPDAPEDVILVDTATGVDTEIQIVSVPETIADKEETEEIKERLAAVGFDEHHGPMNEEEKFEADGTDGESTATQGKSAIGELEAENEVDADEEPSPEEALVEGHAEEEVEHEDEMEVEVEHENEDEMEVEVEIQGGDEMLSTEDFEDVETAINTDVYVEVEEGQEVMEKRVEGESQANEEVEETYDEEDADIQIQIEEVSSEECIANEVADPEALVGEKAESPARSARTLSPPPSTDQLQEPSPTLSLSVNDVASKDILAIANVLANMKSALMSMSDAFGRLGGQVEGMVSLSVDIKAADQIRQLQVMLGDKIIKHKADIETLRILLKSKVKEAVEEKIRSHLYEHVKDSIQQRIEEKVRDQLSVQIPQDLRKQVISHKRQILQIKTNLHNSEARHHNSLQTVPGPNARLRPLLRPLPTPEQSPIIHISRSSSLGASTLATPTTAFPQVPAPTPIKRVSSSSLRSALMPETVPPTPSVHFPRDLSALFALSQDETRRLLREYGLDSATSSPVRETVRSRGLSIVTEESTNPGHDKFDPEEGSEAHAKDMNKLMSHFGVPFLMIPGPKEKIDKAGPLSSRSRRKLLTPLIIK